MDQRSGGARLVLAAWAAAVAIAWLAINLTGAGDASFEGLWPPLHPYYFNLLYATAGVPIAIWLGRRAARAYGRGSYVGRALMLFTAGFVAWAIGNTIWFWFNTCGAWPVLGCDAGAEKPYPSVADVGYLLPLPLYTLALVNLGRLLALRWSDVRSMLWIPAIISVATAYLTAPPVQVGGFTFGLSWLFADDYGTPQIVFSTLYLVSDVVICSLALMLLLRSRKAVGGQLYAPLMTVSASLLLLYVGDMVFDSRGDAYFNGDISDGLYALSLMTMAWALHRFWVAHDELRRRAAARAALVREGGAPAGPPGDDPAGAATVRPEVVDG